MESYYKSIIQESINKEFKRAEILDNYPKLTKKKLTKFKGAVWEYLSIQVPENDNVCIINNVYIVATKYNWYMLFKTYKEVMEYKELKKGLYIIKDLEKFYENKIIKSIEKCKKFNEFSGHNILTKFNVQIWQYLIKKLDDNKEVIIGKYQLVLDEYPYFKIKVVGETERRKSL